jgi:RNA polymerase sigma factor (sigma-70 family)
MLERGPHPSVSLFTDSELTVIREVDAGNIQSACIWDVCFKRQLSSERQLKLVEYIKKGWEAKEELVRDGASSEKKEELRFLIERGKESRDKLLATNTRLVVNRAQKQQNRGVELLDLIQEGYLKFDEAVRRFEPRKGYNFSTYFTWWIDQRIQRAIYTHGRTIRRPERLSTQIFKVERTRDALRQSLDREPTDSEVMSEAGMTKRIYKHVTGAEKETIVSLSSLENEEAGGKMGLFRYKKNYCYSMDRPTEDVALANIMREQAGKSLSKLSGRDSEVLKLYFEEGLTDREIGKKLHISSTYVAKIRNTTLGTLKEKI